MNDRLTIVEEVVRLTVQEPDPLVAEVVTTPQGPSGPAGAVGPGAISLRYTLGSGYAELTSPSRLSVDFDDLGGLSLSTVLPDFVNGMAGTILQASWAGGKRIYQRGTGAATLTVSGYIVPVSIVGTVGTWPADGTELRLSVLSPNALPRFSAADVGKVLVVVDNGSGGGKASVLAHPSGDGVWVLTNTVSAGVPSLSWESWTGGGDVTNSLDFSNANNSGYYGSLV